MVCLRRGDVPQDKGLTLPELQATIYENPDNQALIDCHLLSSYYNNPLYKLDACNTFHYHHLPDLTLYLRHILIDRDDQSKTFLAMCMGMFCIQSKLKRMFVESSLTMQKALINLLHGLLLGLYPYNTQKSRFELRCEIAAKLRQVMCQSHGDFIRGHEHLLTLAVIEYLNNVVPDFCPVECELLIKNPNVRMVINQVCDTFRSRIASVDFDALNKSAGEVLGSVQRYMKQFHHKTTKPSFSVSARKIPALRSDLLDMILRMPYIPNCKHLSVINTLCPMPLQDLYVVEYVWQHINVYSLPLSVYEEQQRALNRVAASCSWRKTLTCIYVCISCALTQKRDVLSQRSTLDCVHKTVHCQRCQRQKTRVDLLGRVLCVRNTSYVLCDQCLSPRAWGQTCAHCVPPGPALPAPRASNCCCVCESKHVVFSKRVLNAEKLRVDSVFLCCKHAKHTIRSPNTIYDLDMLVQDALAK